MNIFCLHVIDTGILDSGQNIDGLILSNKHGTITLFFVVLKKLKATQAYMHVCFEAQLTFQNEPSRAEPS